MILGLMQFWIGHLTRAKNRCQRLFSIFETPKVDIFWGGGEVNFWLVPWESKVVRPNDHASLHLLCSWRQAFRFQEIGKDLLRILCQGSYRSARRVFFLRNSVYVERINLRWSNSFKFKNLILLIVFAWEWIQHLLAHGILFVPPSLSKKFASMFSVIVKLYCH